MDRRSGEASAVMQAPYQTIAAKKRVEPCGEALDFLLLCFRYSVMSCGWRPKIQAAETRFLQMLAGLRLRDKEMSSDIRGELRVEPLHLGVDGGGRLRRRLIRMPPGSLSLEVFWPRPTRGRPRARPRTRWRDCFSPPAWERLGVHQEEVESTAGEKTARNTLMDG